MRIVLTGSSGLIGAALVHGLREAGHDTVRLVRATAPRSTPDEPAWDPPAGVLNPRLLAGADAIIHLSGDAIAKGRWTAARKARIRSSRVDTTRLLCDTLRAMDRPPKTWLCASAVGIYGHRGDEVLTESTPPAATTPAMPAGSRFLAEVCRAWESAAAPAAEA
ncbi:MAG: NAD-dependent epimerase/dehydratase family protein, partial [Candidatus Hydrogenedentes bacterium]|nr:NAD-dependent epimerase/dehydratase family protein [Candidatus Hydrogenedentota bacterium]